MRTFGSDPELMICKDGKIHSAIGIVKGTLENKISEKGHQFYFDNVLAECAIKPSKSKKQAIDNFRECFHIYSRLVKPYKLAIVASHEFTNAQLDNEYARTAGCAPDTCAYEMKQKRPPKELIENGNLRSGGGHIHLGSPTLLGSGPEPLLVVYMMDLLLGVTSVWLDKDPTSMARRQLYGQAGRYRFKEEYGLEYRPLGNFWLSSPRMVGLIYDLAMRSIDLVENRKAWTMWDFDIDRLLSGKHLCDAWKCTGYNPKKLCQGINTSNKKMLEEHFEIARSLMTVGLRKELDKMIEAEDQDFYSAWGLT